MKEPIIAIERGIIYAFTTKHLAERGLEPIDIENEEYELFDSEGLELDAKVVNLWTPIELQDSAPNRYNPEYLKSQLVAFLDRRGEKVEQWKKASLNQIVEKVVTDYPSE